MITRRNFLTTAAAAAAGSLVKPDDLEAMTPSSGTPTRPNILIFMSEQQQGQTVLPGYPCLTPHIDKFAMQGVLFPNAFCPTPHCCPARASFQTGLYPSEHGVFNNVYTNTAIHADPYPGTKFFSQSLRGAGYELAFSGKWHVGRNLPPDSAQPFPFSNNFEDAALNRSPKYFVDQEGSFGVAECTGRPGKCMVQMVDQPPIAWMNKLNTHFPFTFLGDQTGSKSWTDYQVGVDVLLGEFGSVTLWGRIDHLIPCMESKWNCQLQKIPDGYSFTVDSGGRWQVNKSFDNGAAVTNIKSGALTGWPPRKWHHLKLAFRGSMLNAFIDGKPVVVNYADSGRTHAYGMVALGTEWNKVEFDDFCLGATCP